jgi:hypothetical protein
MLVFFKRNAPPGASVTATTGGQAPWARSRTAGVHGARAARQCLAAALLDENQIPLPLVK